MSELPKRHPNAHFSPQELDWIHFVHALGKSYKVTYMQVLPWPMQPS